MTSASLTDAKCWGIYPSPNILKKTLYAAFFPRKSLNPTNPPVQQSRNETRHNIAVSTDMVFCVLCTSIFSKDRYLKSKTKTKTTTPISLFYKENKMVRIFQPCMVFLSFFNHIVWSKDVKNSVDRSAGGVYNNSTFLCVMCDRDRLQPRRTTSIFYVRWQQIAKIRTF